MTSPAWGTFYTCGRSAGLVGNCRMTPGMHAGCEFLQVKDRLQQVWANWRKLTPQQQRTWAEKQLGESLRWHAACCRAICTTCQIHH